MFVCLFAWLFGCLVVFRSCLSILIHSVSCEARFRKRFLKGLVTFQQGFFGSSA